MALKRAIDITVGALLAALALPVIAVLAAASAIVLRAWPIFVQERVGKGGRLIPFPKIRTLPPSAPAATDKYQLGGVAIPAFCRLLRRTHLDELPQLLLVPLGWMSLVGPRPEMPALLARYPHRFAETRGRVRPGCTGLWQLSRRCEGLIFEAPEYDLAYLRHGGPRLDLWLLFRTLRAWLPGHRGGLDLRDVPGWALGPGYLDVYPGLEIVDLAGTERAEAEIDELAAYEQLRTRISA